MSVRLKQTAQTNLQLYNQLLAADYPVAELQQVRIAYDLAARRFAGLLRPDGRCFLAHVVGVASLVAQLGGSPNAVAASLLHAWLSHGPRLLNRLHRKTRRPALTPEVNPAVGDLILRFHVLHRDSAARHAVLEAPDPPSASDRDALLMHLANALDNHVDFARHYRGNRDRAGEELSDIRYTARQLLSQDTCAQLDEQLAMEPPSCLPAELLTGRAGSFTATSGPVAIVKRLLRGR